MNNSFLLSENFYKAEDNVKNGNRFFTGNGYMGLRGTLSELGKDALSQLILSNMYDQRMGKWREPVSLPLPHYYQIKHNEEELNPNNGNMLSHTQTLDMEKAIFSRETQYSVLTLKEERLVCMSNYHLILSTITLQANEDIEIEFNSFINTDVYDINGPHFEIIEKCDDYVSIKTLEKGDLIDIRKKTSIKNGIISLEKDLPLEIRIISSVYSSKDGDDFKLRCEEILNIDFEKEWNSHIQSWKELWTNSKVEIEGDEKAQFGINNSLYHLHSIAPRYKDDLSIAARGLSGQTYKGAIFWDTEIFMLPFFMHTEPKVARSFLKYRINGLKGALVKAKEYGYSGAFYAWEAQEEGFEGCSDFNVIDTFTKRPVRTCFRDKQIHISGDISYAFDKYIEYTKDYSILDEGGLEVLYEIAKFYYSRANLRADRNTVEYLDVLGPDEYHERVDNNAFTNRIAKAAFEIFHKYFYKAKKLKFNLPCKDVDAEVYLSFSKNIKTYDSFDLPENVINQFDGYSKNENVKVSDVRERLIQKNEYWGGATGVATNTQVIKQADVIAMIELFPNEFNQKQIEDNWEYYNPRTEHGSSLSSCMYALSSIRIGKIEEAKELFYKSSLIDVDGGGKQFAGEIYIGGTHPASNGGAWMIIALGFCGLRIKDGKIEVSNNLPTSWESVTFPMFFNGKKYIIYVSKNKCEVRIVE